MEKVADLTLIKTDPAYVGIRRYKYSIHKVEERYPNGCPDHIIAACLAVSEEELNKRYQEIISLIKADLGV